MNTVDELIDRIRYNIIEQIKQNKKKINNYKFKYKGHYIIKGV